MSNQNKPRSHEPIVWLLFAAGGMIAAMLMPALVVITGIGAPVGLIADGSLDHERVIGMLGSPAGKLLVFPLISLLFWHAMHRIFHGLHDLGIQAGLGYYRVLCYGFALLATLLTAGILFLI
ncbi:MAG: fumarate reductase subunit D [Wenzhouxiangella sp.]|nr:fumarate reductase subunit D [Wenzhouxiangella sp.]MCH8479472.1 fumarate reductase subunit D [Wenzhouxiangella sp.]TVR94410.1 MAG: fumarate reductase subunit D [Wenzhouxiangellaceae bacterium]